MGREAFRRAERRVESGGGSEGMANASKSVFDLGSGRAVQSLSLCEESTGVPGTCCASE